MQLSDLLGDWEVCASVSYLRRLGILTSFLGEISFRARTMLGSLEGHSIIGGSLHNVPSQCSRLRGDDRRHDIDNMPAHIICMYTMYIYNFIHSCLQ